MKITWNRHTSPVEDLHFLSALHRSSPSFRMTSKPPSKEISPKLQKTIDKLKTKIKQSADYEVHQELKAASRRYFLLSKDDTFITCRYVRVQDYESAVQLLYLGAEILLENGLGASGADITLSLIEVYNTAHLKPDPTNRGTLAFVAVKLMKRG